MHYPPATSTRPSTSPVYGHGRCGVRWTGLHTSHCGAHGCHRTFSGITAFDRHQTPEGCQDPARLGMAPRLTPYGITWCMPGARPVALLRGEVEYLDEPIAA